MVTREALADDSVNDSILVCLTFRCVGTPARRAGVPQRFARPRPEHMPAHSPSSSGPTRIVAQATPSGQEGVKRAYVQDHAAQFSTANPASA